MGQILHTHFCTFMVASLNPKAPEPREIEVPTIPLAHLPGSNSQGVLSVSENWES